MEREIGPLFKFMDREMIPESDVTVLVRQVERVVSKESNLGASTHDHDRDELYCLLDDVEMEITLGTDTYLVKAPSSVLVPAGMKHATRYAGGKGYMVTILSGESYR